jgi:hypothetical protein
VLWLRKGVVREYVSLYMVSGPFFTDPIHKKRLIREPSRICEDF